MIVSDILPRLKGVKRMKAGHWMARCCAHDDKKPSLSISEVSGRVLLHCFSGCSYESLLAALGLQNGGHSPRFVPSPRKAIPDKPPDLTGLWERWSRETDFHQVDGLAMSLGVESESLRLVGCAWNGRAWAFPMKNAAGEIIGIRLRDGSGNKWAVKGSKQGLFLSEFGCEPVAYVVEGPTDTAAALSIGLSVIGRPSCLGQEDLILNYVQRQKIRRVVIITDNDEPGLRGAAKLQDTLTVPSCIWVPFTKDLREFVILGGTREMIEAGVHDTVWSARKPERECLSHR